MHEFRDAELTANLLMLGLRPNNFVCFKNKEDFSDFCSFVSWRCEDFMSKIYEFSDFRFNALELDSHNDYYTTQVIDYYNELCN